MLASWRRKSGLRAARDDCIPEIRIGEHVVRGVSPSCVSDEKLCTRWLPDPTQGSSPKNYFLIVKNSKNLGTSHLCYGNNADETFKNIMTRLCILLLRVKFEFSTHFVAQ